MSEQDIIPIMQMKKPSLKGQKQVAQVHQPVDSAGRMWQKVPLSSSQ